MLFLLLDCCSRKDSRLILAPFIPRINAPIEDAIKMAWMKPLLVPKNKILGAIRIKDPIIYGAPGNLSNIYFNSFNCETPLAGASTSKMSAMVAPRSANVSCWVILPWPSNWGE